MNAVACPRCGIGESEGLCRCESTPALSDSEFHRFRRYIHELAGIHLTDAKKALVSGRLGRRIRHYGLRSFGDYFELVRRDGAAEERQTMVDLLTTNETYFFREDKHFHLLAETLLPGYRPGEVTAWSAACSSGEEAYTLAMVLAESRGYGRFSILGTDISTRVLTVAKRGVYPIDSARNVPPEYLRRFCLKGVRSQAGNFVVEERLRRHVRFRHFNLNGAWEGLGRFDFIFLRNVMIYFDQETKRRLIERLTFHLEPGGYLFVGHSESLNGMAGRLHTVVPSVYQLR